MSASGLIAQLKAALQSLIVFRYNQSVIDYSLERLKWVSFKARRF